MKAKVQFAGYQFDDIWHDPEGDIPITALKRGMTGMHILGGVAKGSNYTPGAHPFPVTVRVLKGSGDFFLGEAVLPYKKDSRFEVGAHVPHSFIKVVEDTVFIKEVPSTEPV
jgi:hypothetical protein